MTATKLGRVQLLIMQVLWEKRRATAREITEAAESVTSLARTIERNPSALISGR